MADGCRHGKPDSLLTVVDVLAALATNSSDNDDNDASDSSEFDDSFADPDFEETDTFTSLETSEALTDSQQSDLGENEQEIEETQPEIPENIGGESKRQKHAQSNKWKQNVSKNKRLRGVPYLNKKGHAKESKKLGPCCTSGFCRKSSLRDCEAINEEHRELIFKKFWALESWSERRLYIQTLVTKTSVKQSKTDTAASSRRHCSFQYKLKLPNGTEKPVCKTMFASTFGVSGRTVMSWLNEFQDGAADKKINLSRPKSGKTCPISKEDQTFLTKWLEGLPVVPSHYCRSTPSYQNKRFLEPGTTIANLHREYQKAAEQGGYKSVCIKIFSQTFHELNYSVFIPRKDQCDVCVSAKHGNTDEATYQAHIQAKNEAREEKAKP